MPWSQQWPKVLQKHQKQHCNEYRWIHDSWQYLKNRFMLPVHESLLLKIQKNLLFLFHQLFLFRLDRNSPFLTIFDKSSKNRSDLPGNFFQVQIKNLEHFRFSQWNINPYWKISGARARPYYWKTHPKQGIFSQKIIYKFQGVNTWMNFPVKRSCSWPDILQKLNRYS